MGELVNANILEREWVLRSQDQSFSVEVIWIKKSVVKFRPSGKANALGLAEAYKKAVSYLQEKSLQVHGKQIFVVIDLEKLAVELNQMGFFFRELNAPSNTLPNIHVFFVCPGFLSRIVWRLRLRGLKYFPYKFIESVDKNSFPEHTTKEGEGNAGGGKLLADFLSRDIVYYKNTKYKIVHNANWEYFSTTGSFRYALINKEAVLLQVNGELTEELIDESVRIGKEVVKGLDGIKQIMILELQNVFYPSWKVRKYAMARGEETENFWSHRIMISHPLMAISYNTLKIAFPKYAEKTLLVTSFPKAIQQYTFFKQQKESGNKEIIDSKKKQRKKTVAELEQKLQELERNQQLRIQQLFQVFSKISWDEQFKPQPVKISTEDPFYNLFHAINFLQQDIFEILSDHKSLAQSLEKKVIGRTEELYAKNVDLLKVNNELVKVNKELDHFVYSVSHDLRAPIASMKGLVSLLQLEEKPENARVYHMLINKSLDRLDSFIVEILELSRNSRLPAKKEAIDFKDIIDSVFEELEHLGNAALIRKSIDIQVDDIFLSDKHRIVIIFRNILSNAIKYSMPDFKDPFIDVQVKYDAQHVRVQVKDNGTGISPEHLPKVFDMFYRATDKNSGSGLGLYIVKEMVEKLRGNIVVQSEIGKGTTITVALPHEPEMSRT